MIPCLAESVKMAEGQHDDNGNIQFSFTFVVFLYPPVVHLFVLISRHPKAISVVREIAGKNSEIITL